MAVPFSNTGKFLKASDVQRGDFVEFLDEGKWVETKFDRKDKEGNVVLKEDGTPEKQNQYLMLVRYNDTEERSLKLNRASWVQLSEVYGEDTTQWVGKKAIVRTIPTPNGKSKSILLDPADDTGWQAEKGTKVEA